MATDQPTSPKKRKAEPDISDALLPRLQLPLFAAPYLSAERLPVTLNSFIHGKIPHSGE